ncbi:MAG TPA: hypothetical protein VHB73_07570 [Alphaproteobacteria bacterium]|nr:hypothetical protein [Alphaproteobacteria bacterium]
MTKEKDITDYVSITRDPVQKDKLAALEHVLSHAQGMDADSFVLIGRTFMYAKPAPYTKLDLLLAVFEGASAAAYQAIRETAASEILGHAYTLPPEARTARRSAIAKYMDPNSPLRQTAIQAIEDDPELDAALREWALFSIQNPLVTHRGWKDIKRAEANPSRSVRWARRLKGWALAARNVVRPFRNKSPARPAQARVAGAEATETPAP